MDPSSASPVATHRFVTRQRLAIGFGIAVLAVALFGLLGYYWLPGYAKAKIETLLSEQLNRSVTIQAIDIQPYTLELTVLDFRIAEKNDTDHLLFAFDRLYVDLSIESIRHLAPVVTRVTLTAPKLRLVREDKHRFNISDLIEQFKPQPDEPVEDAQHKQRFAVSNISIRGGAVEFEDRLKNSHQNIDEIDLDLPFIANFESAHIIWVEPFLSARINGAPFALESKLRPFADERKAELSLTLNDIDLTDIDEYSPIPLGIRLLSGKLDSDLSLIFTQALDEAPSVRLSGRAALKELIVENKAVKAPHQVTLKQLDVTLPEAVLTEPKPVQVAMTLADAAITRHGEAEPAISLPKLNIDTITIDRAQRHIEVSSITLDEATARIHRQADGGLDLAQLFAPVALTADSAPDTLLTPTSEPTQASVAAIPIPGNKPANLTHAPNKLEVVSTLPTKTTTPIPDHKPAATAGTGIAETNADQRVVATELPPPPEPIEADKGWTAHIAQVTLSSASVRRPHAVESRAHEHRCLGFGSRGYRPERKKITAPGAAC